MHTHGCQDLPGPRNGHQSVLRLLRLGLLRNGGGWGAQLGTTIGPWDFPGVGVKFVGGFKLSISYWAHARK